MQNQNKTIMPNNEELSEDWLWTKIIKTIVFTILFIVILSMWGCPRYNVWQQGLEGQAELARATQNRQIKIQESQAKADAAKYEAEVTRAIGVAKVNKIIGESLKNNEGYLYYLWINALNERTGKQTIVYAPKKQRYLIRKQNNL